MVKRFLLPIHVICPANSIAHCRGVTLNAVRNDLSWSPILLALLPQSNSLLVGPIFVDCEQPMMMAGHHGEGEQFVSFIREMEKGVGNNLRLFVVGKMSHRSVMV